jgi:membrane-bound serine protease (ClpP class)
VKRILNTRLSLIVALFLMLLNGSGLVAENTAAKDGSDFAGGYIALTGSLEPVKIDQLQTLLNDLDRAGVPADAPLLLKIDTRGGSLSAALGLMDLLAATQRPTIAWVSRETVGPGAYVVLACDEVVFGSRALLAAQDAKTDQTLLASVDQARIRTRLPDKPFRGEIANAFADPEEGLSLNDTVLSRPGRPLVITAHEATRSFGEPSAPLLANGLADSDEAFFEAALNRSAAHLLVVDNGLVDPDHRFSRKVAPPTAKPVVDTRREAPSKAKAVTIYVVPIEGPITEPQLFILRRALKEAIDQGIDGVVLQMNTPGGALGVTLDMMNALDRFQGDTFTLVDNEAISAGSYIAVATDYIYFVTGGIMGAAEAVTGQGQDISESMQRKINSYLRARVRALNEKDSELYRYRADVQRAMMDPDFVLEIDGVLLKSEGDLLSLTAQEATKRYGNPPVPLLALGIVADVESMLKEHYGEDAVITIKAFELTWSEELAKWLKLIAPGLLGVGMLMLFIEFKTPGFGFIGIIGIMLLMVVFASNHVAGLAGYEVVVIFFLGIILLAIELFVIPGTLVAGIAGMLMIIGALLWSMVDFWPSDGWPALPGLLAQPMIDLSLGLLIAVAGGLLLGRFMPKSWFVDKIVLAGSVGGNHRAEDLAAEESKPKAGATGHTVSGLFPSGTIEIEGRRYPARAEQGTISKDMPIVVVRSDDFDLVVRRHP